MATKGLVAGFAEKRPAHLLSEYKRWPPKGQHQVFSAKRADHLQAEGRKWPRTGSAADFAAKRLDHLLPEGRRWPPKGQQQVLQQRDQITYPLRVGDDHQRSIATFAKQPNHLLAGSRR